MKTPSLLSKKAHSLLLITLFLTISGTSQNIIVNPYLQNGSPNSMIIMWETDAPNDGFVDWGDTAFSLTNTVVSTTTATNGNNRIHTAIITGLLPDTKYFYKVRTSTGVTSNFYSFNTHPTKDSETSINFVAISDMQRDGSNPNVFETIVTEGILPVAEENYDDGLEGIEAILIPGDLVSTGNYAAWRNDFFALSEAITPFVPMYPVAGNHEYFGVGLSLYLDYFNLPLNGATSNPEEWWFKDMSNVRLIGLNSNSPLPDLEDQLIWLDGVLDEAGTDATIDFVFVQLHHPYKSELWTPGELDFTGDIISLLEDFSTEYGKPSIHLFGHTHAYSRGQSRDHNHLWVNVATAGGAIDNWGEFPNADYEEFVISEDEYGFVMLEVEAGSDPKFVLKRFSQGDENIFEENTLSDQITIKRYDEAPETPQGLFPTGATDISCVNLKASTFSNGTNTHQASHWQLVEGCDFDAPNLINIWKQNENWYNEINTQMDDDLTDEKVNLLTVNNTYCWRVRYRNSNLTWSAWSQPLSFTTTNPTYVTGNLVLNAGAESGVNNWEGDIESLLAKECGSVPAYDGNRLFAVGGVCTNEQDIGVASQDIDVSSFATQIDNEEYQIEYAGFLRSFDDNNDLPEMRVECYDANDLLLASSIAISNNTPEWLLKRGYTTVPSGTRKLKVILNGTRLTGSDNDSYFDNLSVRLIAANCPVLSIADTSINNTIRLFPNPAENTLFYTSTNVFDKIVVYTILGKQVIETSSVSSGTNSIDITNLTSGIYIINFRTEDASYNLKFVKK